MRGNNFINKFCVFSLNGNETCSNTGSKLDILFKRPNHNAIISSDIISGLNESARIYISSTNGDENLFWLNLSDKYLWNKSNLNLKSLGEILNP